MPEPEPGLLRDPDTGEPGVRLEFRTEDGELAAAEHRTATMFTWWDGLPGGHRPGRPRAPSCCAPATGPPTAART